MIEYYTLMHKGSEPTYRDNYFMNYGHTITVLIVYAGKESEGQLDQEVSSDLSKLISSSNNYKFEDVSNGVEWLINDNYDYLLLQISDDYINIERHGSVYAYIIKKGELKLLPNGYFTLEDDDRVVSGTGAFFKYLTDIAILSDASSSISSEEWMDSLAYRIADQSAFCEGNLTAATFIVRKGF